VTKILSPQHWVALALIAIGSWMIVGSKIYGLVILHRSDPMWPVWVPALAPIVLGIAMLLRLRLKSAKSK
jgi:hypothetical protein